MGDYLDMAHVFCHGHIHVRPPDESYSLRLLIIFYSARWISNHPISHQGLDIFSLFAANGSTPTVNVTAQGSPENATSASFLSHPTVRALSSDIVSGQIIASLIVLAFVAIFLLREWISQNARPGVFEDVPEEDVPPPPPIPPQRRLPPPPQIPMNPAAPQPPVRRGGPVIPAIANRRAWRRDIAGPIHPAPPAAGNFGDGLRRLNRMQNLRDLPPVQEDKGKGKGKSTAIEPRAGIEDENQEPARRRRRRMSTGSASSLPEDSDAEAEDARGNYSRLRQRRSFYRRLNALKENRSSEPLALEPSQDQFTFTADPPQRTDSEVSEGSTRRIFNLGNVPLKLQKYDSDDFESLPPTPESEKNEKQSTGSFTVVASSSSLQDDTSVVFEPSLSLSDTDSSKHLGPSSAPPVFTPGGTRRPPLPSATLSSVAGPSTSPPRPIPSQAHTPLASPGLASYRAPEELNEAQNPTSWGDSSEDSPKEEDMETEYRHFWRDPPNSDSKGGHEHVADDSGDYHDDDTDVETDAARWRDEDDFHDVEDDELDHFHVPPGHGPPEDNPPPEGENGGAQAVGGRPPDANEDLEANVEDDMDGALEGEVSEFFVSALCSDCHTAIGLRGPIHNVLQNVRD